MFILTTNLDGAKESSLILDLNTLIWKIHFQFKLFFIKQMNKDSS